MAFVPADYRNRLVVTDGDLPTELFLRGWQGADIPEQANLQRPEIVRDVEEAFLEAGAKVLVTNTAGANALAPADRLDTGGASQDELLAMNRQGAAICRTAVSERRASDVPVFGAMGPIDRLLLLEEVDETALAEAYEAQARALAAGGVDAILCRSFIEIRALCIAVRAAAGATSLPVVGSLIFDCGPERTQTALGVTVPQASAELMEAGAAIMGCDCGESPDSVPTVVALMRQSWGLPIWVKVDAGMPQLVEGRVAHPETPEEFAARLTSLGRAGANFVGGCCGASAGHVAAMAAIQKESKPQPRWR